MSAHRQDGIWKKGSIKLEKRHKRAGLEGPIRDVFLGPVAFVYGSLGDAEMRASREVARILARRRYGIDVEYPIIADVEVDAKLARSHSLVLVGIGKSHQVLTALHESLPIRVKGEHIVAGGQRFAGKSVGTMFIHPHPQTFERYVVVVTAPTIPGLYQALAVPHLLPDFIIYDARLASAAGQQVLGEAEVLAGGYFDSKWALPSTLEDRIAETR